MFPAGAIRSAVCRAAVYFSMMKAGKLSVLPGGAALTGPGQNRPV